MLSPNEQIAYQQLLADERWNKPSSFREQCSILKRYLRNETVMVSYERLGDMFGGKYCVEKQLKKLKKEEKDELMIAGRPPLLNEEQRTFLINMINDMHSRKYYPSYDEIRSILEDQIKLIISNDQIRNYIRNNTEFNFAIGDCMDQDRIDSSYVEIDLYYDILKASVKGVDARLFFNLDEVGEEEYSDAQELTVIVPKSYSKSRIPIGFVRRKRCTGLVCIAMSGENQKPLIITPRKTIDSEIFILFQDHHIIAIINRTVL